MAGKLIVLPLRVWLHSARLLTRAAGEAAGRAVALAGQTLGAASSNGSPDGRAHDWREASPPAAVTDWHEESIDEPEWHEESIDEPEWHEESIDEPEWHEESIDEPEWHEESIDEPVFPVDVEHPHDEAEPPDQSPPPPPRDVPVIEEPIHVSEEPELVRESAEPGAEDGAGAQLTVTEPWNGYARMNAREVIARAREAGPAELAAVRLYESLHRSRQTVLAAVDRQLKLAGGPHPA